MSYDPHGYPPQPDNQRAGWEPTVVSGPPVQPQPYQPYQPYQPPQQPPMYGAAPGYRPQQPIKQTSPLKVLLVTVGVVAAVCTTLGVLTAVTGDPQPTAAPAPALAATTPAATPSRLRSPAPLSPVDEPAEAKMPDVRGQNAAVAEDYLRKLGFTNIKFGSRDELDSWVVLPENWTVRKQSTKAGRTIPTDTLIVLTCTKQA